MSTAPTLRDNIHEETGTPSCCRQIPLWRRDGLVVAYALVDEVDASLAQDRWCIVGGYAVRSLARSGGSRKWVRMHRLIAQAPEGVEVDHINRNRLDNRRCNLRLTDRFGNARNRSLNRASNSGYKGVRQFGSQGGRWMAEISYEGRVFFLGVYQTAEEAAVTYDLAAMALHGEFAAPNFSYPEPLPLLDELRTLLLCSIGKRVQWHRRFDKLRDRLPMIGGVSWTVPTWTVPSRSADAMREITASVAEVLRVD